MSAHDPLIAPVLVLNRNYQPVRVTTVRHAFLMLYVDRAHALDSDYEVYDFDGWAALGPVDGEPFVGTTSGGVRTPRVVLLREYNRVPRTPLRLSRRNILLRDDYTCQYCGCQPHPRDLNLDHVIPRSRGGESTWENLVASCRRCNLEKGARTPEECGMRLLKRPRRPNWSVVVQLASIHQKIAEWEPFLAAAGAAE